MMRPFPPFFRERACLLRDTPLAAGMSRTVNP